MLLTSICCYPAEYNGNRVLRSPGVHFILAMSNPGSCDRGFTCLSFVLLGIQQVLHPNSDIPGVTLARRLCHDIVLIVIVHWCDNGDNGDNGVTVCFLWSTYQSCSLTFTGLCRPFNLPFIFNVFILLLSSVFSSMQSVCTMAYSISMEIGLRLDATGGKCTRYIP